MNRFRDILQNGIKLASDGNLDGALRKFNEGLKLKPTKDDEHWVVHLHRNAALIHEKRGNLRKAKQCYLSALKYDRSDPYTYFSLGDLCERLSQMNAARRYFARCQEFAVQREDEDLL